MQVLAHHQAGLGRDQGHVRGRLIPRQIRHASGHEHLVEKRIERDERVGVGKAGQRNALVGEELLFRRPGSVGRGRHDDISRGAAGPNSGFSHAACIIYMETLVHCSLRIQHSDQRSRRMMSLPSRAAIQNGK